MVKNESCGGLNSPSGPRRYAVMVETPGQKGRFPGLGVFKKKKQGRRRKKNVMSSAAETSRSGR
jgi:hypothetical protein